MLSYGGLAWVAAINTRHNHWRLIVLVTLLKPVSNLFLAWGMQGLPPTLAINPLFFLRAMADPLVAVGIAMQIVWLLTRMSLLSVADLSFVLPVTASGYVLSTLLGRFVLHEQVSVSRWLGVAMITLGTAFVASSPRITPRAGGRR
jgi:drug/metabolite transporter (DMT)-like permease